ncbi:MAG: methyltransferase [Acidobacteriota bacterium]|nr:methyltransferase [Acidobacteriota bacterium]
MTFPVPDRAAAAALGDALRGLAYEADTISELIGDDIAEREEVVVAERRLSESPLESMIRLLYLELPVAERKIGSGVAEALVALGLVSRSGSTLAPRARVVPVDETLLASDGFTRDSDDPPDYVATYTPTARTCDLLTPRPRVKRALDVGTGSGIHALLAARHAKHVVAIDVNQRALAYTELNAALNGLDNVECRNGSFFDPVEGEAFGLITCNAPFVVSPEQRWAYRDSGFRGDDVTAHVVREAASHLADGGYATLLGSWLIVDEDAPEERPAEWLKATGCDAWILTSIESDPLEHAATWNSSFFADAGTYAEALERWTRYLGELGARGVGEGAILLHRNGGRASLRIDEIDEDSLEDADAQIRRAFANRHRAKDLLDARLRRAMPIRVERELGRKSADVVLDEGTCSILPATPEAVALVERLDGRRTLRKLGADKRAVKLCRELVGLGALQIVD